MKTLATLTATFLRRLLKTVALVVFAVLLFVVVFAFAFFATKEFHLPTKQIASLVEKYAPENIGITFTDFEIKIQRPGDRWLAKRISIDTDLLCVRYEGDAVTACLDSLHLAFTVSSEGIERIEPIELLGVNANVDLPKMPKDEEPKQEGGFDVVAFLRKHVLPKWDLDGSRVELRRFVIITEPNVGYTATFDLEGAKKTGTIDLHLHEFRSLEGPLFASANAKVVRPASWGGKRAVAAEANQWKIGLDALLELDKKRKFNLDADANVTSFRELDTRLRVVAKGIKPLQEARLAMKLNGDAAEGLLSLKLGAAGSEVRALDFVDCGWRADLAKETGSIKCGPDSVRLVITERSFLKRPDLFVLRPTFDLNVRKVLFGEVKGADVDLDLKLDHKDFVALGIKTDATFRKGEGPATYSVKGGASLALSEFANLVSLLRETPFSIPAPLNVLKGRIDAKTDVDLTQDGGKIVYKLGTDLTSTYQTVKLEANGATTLTATGPEKSLKSATDITVDIADLRLSAPRFDLRAPPALKPDSRFGPLAKNPETAAKPVTTEPADFKLRIRTLSPQAVRIATNLTKAAIPLGFDVSYDAKVVPTALQPSRSPVSGYVVVGHTPIDLFKRNAVVEQLRVDLLQSGANRIDGSVRVAYLDYTIKMFIAGAMQQPQIRFDSDPPLDDDQIVSVLLFGRPSHELGEDEKSSVASFNAAITDSVLGLSSLYLLASTPIESVGYDSERGRVTARVGLGGGTSLEVGGGGQESGSGVGIRKRLSQDITFRSEVETLGTTGKRTISALIEWVKKF